MLCQANRVKKTFFVKYVDLRNLSTAIYYFSKQALLLNTSAVVVTLSDESRIDTKKI